MPIAYQNTFLPKTFPHMLSILFRYLFFKAASFISTAGWSARTSDTDQYVSVLFYGTVVVKGVQTGGRMDRDEWVTKYKMQYQETYFAKWLTYQDPPGRDKVGVSHSFISHSCLITSCPIWF